MMNNLRFLFHKLSFLEILNSPFKWFRVGIYFGNITMGIPYFLPRKWRKYNKKELLEEAIQRVAENNNTTLAGYIKEFNLGTEADIIPKKTGNLSSKFMRDYYIGTSARLTRCVRVGGFMGSQNQTGLSCINTTIDATSYLAGTGCRTISNFVSAPQNN